MKRRIDLALIATFATLLLLPLIVSLCRGEFNHAPAYHWLAAALPEMSPETDLGAFQNYDKEVEEYFNGNFGGRDVLNACNVRFKYALLPDDLGPDVMVGRDGWYYYSGWDLADDCLGYHRLTDQQLTGWRQVFEKRRDWLAARGIDYLLVIAPNKESIYPVYLPAWLNRHLTSTRLDQFLGYMRQHSTVKILDLRPALRKAARSAPVYYQTDTHWNLMGAFAASQAIASELAGQLLAIKPLSLEDFEIRRITGQGGDLARLSKLPLIDQNIFDFRPRASLPTLDFSINGTNTVTWQMLGTVPVPEFSMMTVRNDQDRGQVIVVGDSFSLGLTPFLGYEFGKIVFCWQDTLNDELIQRSAPRLVINELVERRFFRFIPVN